MARGRRGVQSLKRSPLTVSEEVREALRPRPKIRKLLATHDALLDTHGVRISALEHARDRLQRKIEDLQSELNHLASRLNAALSTAVAAPFYDRLQERISTLEFSLGKIETISILVKKN